MVPDAAFQRPNSRLQHGYPRATGGEPLTASAVADRVGTSVQNASYYLGKLSDAGLIEVPASVYSEKGCEMKLYRAVETELRLEPTG